MANKKQEEMLNAMESSMQRFFHKETEIKMTPKQALEEIGKHLDYSQGLADERPTSDSFVAYKILEKELKDYYALQKECEEAKWYQEHKALEIIKEILDDDLFSKLNSNSRKIIKEIIDKLPKEKLDLLKEVLE